MNIYSIAPYFKQAPNSKKKQVGPWFGDTEELTVLGGADPFLTLYLQY